MFKIWKSPIETSTLTFTSIEGLQQGTVDSPLLFNIFANTIINQFGLNDNTDTHSIAFADDLIIYVAGMYPNTNQIETIPTKNIVRYLSVNIDYLLRLNKHTDIQLIKAMKAARANNWLLKNRVISSKSKIICYQLLISSILTYAAPIWWNIIERSCLRACIGKHYSLPSLLLFRVKL